jgi:hypothetical protein
LFKNLLVLEQVQRNLPQIPVFLGGSCLETEVSKNLLNILKTPGPRKGLEGCASSHSAPRCGRSDSGVPESPVFCGLGICGANSQTAKNALEDSRFPRRNLL